MGIAYRIEHAFSRLNNDFVWILKRRVKVLRGAIAERAKEISEEIAEHREFEIDAQDVMPDHV